MVPASITEMEDMIQVIVDVKVRDWVTARDMVMTVEVDEILAAPSSRLYSVCK